LKVKVGDGSTAWISLAYMNITASDYYPSGLGASHAYISGLTDASITTPRSGQILIYKENNSKWENELSPMLFNIANVRLLSGQNINVTRFKCPAGTKAYCWQAAACNSGGASTGDLYIEILSGNTQTGNWSSIYKTSAATLQQGYPLGVSTIDSDIEVRFMYSSTSGYGSEGSQLQYGTAMMQVSVY